MSFAVDDQYTVIPVTSIGFFGGVGGQGQAIGVDAAGNVVVAGTRKATWLSSGAEQAREFVVLKLSGDTATGSGWRRSTTARR